MLGGSNKNGNGVKASFHQSAETEQPTLDINQRSGNRKGKL
jgi:hypothetical protein